MNYLRPRNIMLWILVLIPLLVISNNVSLYAKEGTINREENRKLVPIDKLKIRLENPKREQMMQPDRVIDVFGVKKGESVADVGAGTGYFSFRLVSRVGVEGRVYAVEIEDELLDYIRKKMEKNSIANIIPVKSSESDPNLRSACCDKILLINTYNYISDPVTFMKNVRKSIKPDGLVAIIDVDAAKVKAKKKTSKPNEVIDEMKRAGFVLRESHDFLASRFFLVFSTGAIE